MTTDHRRDSELIAASVGRATLFDEIFRRHFPDIYRFAARQIGDVEGEEVAAETFARAFAQRHRFRGEGSARPWLFGICVNVMHGTRRALRRRGRAYQRAHESGVVEAADDAVLSAMDAERQGAALRLALEDLRPAEREVLMLFALAGLSYAEIAVALGMPSGTVRSHLFRARRSLRCQLPQDSALAEGMAGCPTPVAVRRLP